MKQELWSCLYKTFPDSLSDKLTQNGICPIDFWGSTDWRIILDLKRSNRNPKSSPWFQITNCKNSPSAYKLSLIYFETNIPRTCIHYFKSNSAELINQLAILRSKWAKHHHIYRYLAAGYLQRGYCHSKLLLTAACINTRWETSKLLFVKRLRTNINYSSFLLSNDRMDGFSPPNSQLEILILPTKCRKYLLICCENLVVQHDNIISWWFTIISLSVCFTFCRCNEML